MLRNKQLGALPKSPGGGESPRVGFVSGIVLGNMKMLRTAKITENVDNIVIITDQILFC